MTIFSGTGSAVASSQVSFMMSTAYDSVLHTVPSSGTSTNVSNAQAANTTLNTPSEANFEVWMSGDSEGVAFVTRQGAATYDTVCVGRANSFSSRSDNPFPLYINSSSVSAIVVTNTQAQAVGGNPPQSFGVNDVDCQVISPIDNTNQPYDLDAATSIFFASPILLLYADDVAPIRRGVAGSLRSVWATVGTSAGILAEGRLTASGSFGVQTYRAFPLSAEGLLIRES